MKEKSFDVIAIGNAILDVLITTEDSFLTKNSLSKGNMMLISQEKAEELYSISKSDLETSGGSAANTIAGLASLGNRSCFIGRVKEDQLGKTFIKDICSTGATFNASPIKEGPGTARCFIYVTPDAERTMCTYLGCSILLEPENIDFSIFSKTKVLYLEGYLWDLESAKNTLQIATDKCKSSGGKAALSLSDSFCIERHRESFQRLLENYIDLLFGNEQEIIALYESANLEDAINTIKKKCDIAVITKGPSGSIVISKENKYQIDPFNFGKTIDTTGAGDLYASGFLHGYVNGKNLQECGKLGSICSGSIVTQLGSRSEKSLIKLIKDNLK